MPKSCECQNAQREEGNKLYSIVDRMKGQKREHFPLPALEADSLSRPISKINRFSECGRLVNKIPDIDTFS